MRYALTSEQVYTAERTAVAESGVSLDDLMARAGEALASAVTQAAEDGPVIVLAGPGNNGGDGWTTARLLAASGRDVRVLSVRDPHSLDGPAGRAALAAVDAGVRFDVPDRIDAGWLDEAACVVDALLGIGSRPPLREPIADWVAALSGVAATVVAADVPTGVDADTGEVSGPAVHADVTVTFSAPKPGLITYPGAAYVGCLVVADVGVPDELLEAPGAPEVWSREEYAELLPVPEPDAHKNARGRVLVVAGSGAYPGAAVLAAKGAQRAGAGYVTLAVPESIVPVAQAHLVSAPVTGLPEHRGRTFAARAADAVVGLAADYDAVVLGPGLTVADGAAALARSLVSRLDKPLVLDADGLNALVDATGLLAGRGAPAVVTPHPGEAARLLGKTVSEVQADRVSCAKALATDAVACVLKGAGTVIASGGRVVVNTTGTPALATAGTGDILSGIVGTFLAQGLDPLHAGALSAWIHGRAGEIAAEDLTPVCVIAEDVLEHVPYAVSELLEVW